MEDTTDNYINKVKDLGGFEEIERINKEFKKLGDNSMRSFLEMSWKIGMDDPFVFSSIFQKYLDVMKEERLTTVSFRNFLTKINTRILLRQC